MGTRIASGVSEYPAGSESATYSVTVPGTVAVGDVLIATLEAANNSFGITAAPTTNARQLITGLASGGSHYHGGVWAVRIGSVGQTLSWTWGGVVRGSLAWTVIRGADIATIVAAVTSFSGNYLAPSITAPAYSMIYAGISMGSGSATGSWPGGWVQLTDPNQRQGLIASRGIQNTAGPTGTVQWTTAPNADARAWQIAVPDPNGAPETPEPGTAFQGVVEYPTGSESTTYSLITPSTALAGDVLLVTLESASNAHAITAAPSNSRLLVSGQSNPSGAHFHGGVWAVTVTGPSQTISWTWAGAVRGSLAWVLVRGTTRELAVAAVSEWTSVSGTAPAITVPNNTSLYVGLSQASGSSLVSAAGWTTLVDATQRNGGILSKAGVASAGVAPAVAVTPSDGAAMRAWQVGFPGGSTGGGGTGGELLVIQGIPTSTAHKSTYWTEGVDLVRLIAASSATGTPLAAGNWVSVDGDGWSRPTITGLDPDTSYWFRPEFDKNGVVSTGTARGPIRTAPTPMTPTSFSFAFGGDNQDPVGDTSLAYNNLLAHANDIRFVLSTGDTHDGDNASTLQSSHRQDWEEVFAAYPGFATTVAKIPFAQTFGDHDQGGGNNAPPGVWTAPNIAAYQQVMPYPESTMLPRNTAWSTGWGRVRIIGLDCYHQRTSTYKLSSEQMTWLEAELAKPEPLKVILVSAVWYDAGAPEGWPDGDGWADYPAQRNAIANLISASKAAGKTAEVLALHGDQHALAAMSGAGNPFGGFPVVGGSPFSAYPSHKGEVVPDSGRWPTSLSSTVHQHGVVSIIDNGDNGMIVQFRGYDDSNTVRVQLDVWIGESTGPSEVAGATAEYLTSPAERWAKAPTRPLWLDPAAGKWRSVLPTPSGHRLFDLSSTSPAVQGLVVDSRQDARVTALHKGSSTYVLRQHSSGCLLNIYGENFALVLQNAPVPLSATNHDASPVALVRTSNGHLWAAVITDGAIRVTRSTNGGSSWSPAFVTSLWAAGTTGVVSMWETGGNLVLLGTANDGPGRLVRRIPITATDISAGWIMESLPILTTPLTSDDHLSGDILPDGRLILAAKTSGSVSAETPLLYTLIRELSGQWVMKTFEGGPDDIGFTRPRVVVTLDAVHVYYGSYQSPFALYRKSAPIGTPTTFGARELLLTGPDWRDSVVTPSAADIALDRVQYPVLAANADTGRITLMWHEAGDAPPSENSGFTIRLRRNGQTVPVTELRIRGYPPILRGAVRRGNMTIPFV